jgi:SAM-dependent methyltransferase
MVNRRKGQSVPEDINKTNISAYDQWAAFYDRYPNPTIQMDERFFPPFYAEVAGRRVLELGCGTGRHTARLLALGARVTGLDQSPGMLAEARARLPAGTELIEGDFFAAGLPGGAFDALVESLVLEHLPDLAAFFARASELLKPSASIYLSELHPARLAAGTKAHFKDPASGEEITTASFAHPAAAFSGAAAAHGFRLVRTAEHAGDEILARARPGWEKYQNQPMIQLWHFAR